MIEIKKIEDLEFRLFGETMEGSYLNGSPIEETIKEIIIDKKEVKIKLMESYFISDKDTPDFELCFDDNDASYGNIKFKIYNSYVLLQEKYADSEKEYTIKNVKNDKEIFLMITDIFNITNEQNYLIWYIISKFGEGIEKYENIYNIHRNIINIKKYERLGESLLNFNNENFKLKISENLSKKYLQVINDYLGENDLGSVK